MIGTAIQTMGIIFVMVCLILILWTLVEYTFSIFFMPPISKRNKKLLDIANKLLKNKKL